MGSFTVTTPNKYNLCKSICHRIKQSINKHKKQYTQDMWRITISTNLDITLTFQFHMSANKINHTYTISTKSRDLVCERFTSIWRTIWSLRLGPARSWTPLASAILNYLTRNTTCELWPTIIMSIIISTYYKQCICTLYPKHNLFIHARIMISNLN